MKEFPFILAFVALVVGYFIATWKKKPTYLQQHFQDLAARQYIGGVANQSVSIATPPITTYGTFPTSNMSMNPIIPNGGNYMAVNGSASAFPRNVSGIPLASSLLNIINKYMPTAQANVTNVTSN